MQVLLGNPKPAIPSSAQNLNPDYAATINSHVAHLNGGLKLRGKLQFIGSHNCPGNPSSPVLGPAVFASSGNKPVFAVFGLNPLFSISSICQEKKLAGNNLADYAAFYNSKSCTTNGVFPFLFGPLGSYYRNIFLILYSLCKSGFEEWDLIFPRQNRKEIVKDTYLKLIKHCPIIVSELIPFHSSQTGTINIANLYTCDPNYKDYHDRLFVFLDLQLASNGILFSHGKAASNALRQVLVARGVVITRISAKYEFAIWNGRLVIILDQFLRTRGGVNSNSDFNTLINDILKELKKLGMTVPCKCL